jgi:hypothetical protein
VKALEIEFVVHRSAQWIGPLLFSLSAVALLLSWNYFVGRRDAAREAVATQRRAQEAASQPQPLSPEDLKRQEFQSQERAALAYPWRGVFEALEAAGGADVKVVGFSHDRMTRKSHVVLEGLTYSAVDEAVIKMKAASPAETEWSIESITREQTGAEKLVRASVVGSW